MNLTLTKTDIRDIVNALAFTSSADVCANISKKDASRFARLAEKISSNNMLRKPGKFWVSGGHEFENGAVVKILSTVLKIRG